MITGSRDIHAALGHLEAALEETCATLMALESARMAGGEAAVNAPAIQGQISKAIASVRCAISEMRALHEVETSTMAFGFVLADPEWSRMQARRRQAGRHHDRPRRTA
jgi:hypothetical protein